MIRSGFSLFLVLNFAFMANTFAQDHDQTKEQAHKTEDHDQVHKKHVISASLNHTVIFSAIKNDENKTWPTNLFFAICKEKNSTTLS